jgi:hypothetical protein
MRKRNETLLKFHDSARQTLECALARPFHQHVEALVHSHCLPSPLGYQDGVKPCFQELVEAPPGALTLLIQRAPYMAKHCAHGVFHCQLVNDFALQIDCGEFAAVFGAKLIDMDETFHSFNS